MNTSCNNGVAYVTLHCNVRNEVGAKWSSKDFQRKVARSCLITIPHKATLISGGFHWSLKQKYWISMTMKAELHIGLLMILLSLLSGLQRIEQMFSAPTGSSITIVLIFGLDRCTSIDQDLEHLHRSFPSAGLP
jgi:hypothetical protein